MIQRGASAQRVGVPRSSSFTRLVQVAARTQTRSISPAEHSASSSPRTMAHAQQAGSDVPRTPSSSKPLLPSSGDSPPRADGAELCDSILAGDVICIRGNNGYIADIGAANGYLGHVLVVLSPMRRLERSGSDWTMLAEVMPKLNLSNVWKVTTIESTRRAQGLYRTDLFIHADPTSEKTSVVAEFKEDSSELDLIDNSSVELWSCPSSLRSRISTEDVVTVAEEMKSTEKNWSYITAARAVLRSAALPATRPGRAQMALLKEVKECWEQPPICTSIVVIFWQRLLCRIAKASSQSSMDLIRRWMPLKADRGLPGDLIDTMRKCGWTHVRHLDIFFRV